MASYSFQGCADGWSAAGNNSDWQCGTPSSGPGNDHSGDGFLWATDLGGDANNCQDSTLTSPTIDLAALSGTTVKLRFWHWYDFRECTCLCGLSPDESDSGGIIEVNSGNGWTLVTPDGGYENGGYHINCAHPDYCNAASCGPDGMSTAFTSEGVEQQWHETVVDISTHTTSSFQVRFHFGSHAGFGCFPDRPGWYIDDVVIAPEPCP